MGKARLGVAVLGAGQLGRAVAEVLRAAGAEVRIWARRETVRRALRRRWRDLTVVDSIAAACEGIGVVFLAVPASAFREVAGRYGDVARGDHVVLHATRGVGDGFTLPHRILREETCVRRIGVLGGPLQARELSSGRPLAVVVASRFDETVAAVRQVVEGAPVSVHPSRDVIGVEIAGALSNVAALAIGMSDALGLGETARGVLATRGLGEAARLGEALGADPLTFAGLAGVGDLIPRRLGTTERHRALGAMVVQGQPLGEALARVRGEVEGVVTAREAGRLARERALELPLVRTVAAILAGEEEARPGLDALLSLDLDLGRGFVRA